MAVAVDRVEEKQPVLAGLGLAGLPPAFAAYASRLRGFDEMVDGEGRIRPHWQTFAEGWARMGPAGWQAAADSTKRLLRESGIAFNVYADPDDRAHAWRLDLVPVLLHEAEWRTVEQGLIQRARLVEAVLQDIHGDARLLRDGLLPASMVFGSDDFLRPAVRPAKPVSPLLYTYACDIARTADGRWVVLADQTDIALGNGYLLGSRVALSHGLAELFNDCNTRRLAGHYMALQQSLQQASPRTDGRMVVLSAGPGNPSYFSNAYLARYLGYTLAESGDLTVRDNAVFLKTLDGLQRVAVIVRKLPGRACDPLMLPGGGFLGVAGLAQAARTGRVVLANGLGSGVLHNRALAAFAPKLCRRLLREGLILEDAPTLWLGDAKQRAAAMERLAGLRIGQVTQRSDPGEAMPTLDGAALTGDALDSFLARLDREGHRLVAQEPVRLATTPSLDGDRLVPTPFAIRCYVAWTENGYRVLPGGLVRLSGESTTVGLPNGFGSKDLWVVGDAAEPAQPSLLRNTMAEVHLRRTGRDLLSRTADNLFWLGRYAERTEGTMRLLRSVLGRILEDSRPDAQPVLLQRTLDVVFDKLAGPRPTPVAGWPQKTLEDQIALLMFQPDRAYGLRECLDHLHRTATLVRDQISHDAWRMLNALHIDRRWREPRGRILAPQALELLDDGVRALSAFAGTEAENMTRNFAWRFLEMGRRLERGGHLVDLVRGLVLSSPDPENDGSLRLLLELGDSFMTYRSRYVMTPLLAPVIDLLLLDETNPRALAFQLGEIDVHFGFLPSEGPHRSAEQRLVLRLLTELRLADLGQLLQRDVAGELPELADLLTRCSAALPELSDIIARAHFAHAETPLLTLAMRRRDEP
ncbi:MAG: circularly permuted type 2 ATP-grasp protein [Geminicoccaceae bacterium]